MTEQLLESNTPFEGRLVNVRVDRVRLPSGRETTREVVEHPGAVAILPVMADGSMVLARQFRYAVGRDLLEVPAGTREPDESAEECARREIVEEVGLQAGRLELLVRFFVSPGWCNEEIVIFRAWDLEETIILPEEDEAIDVVTVRPDEIPELIASGQIADAKTITAVLMHRRNAG